MRIRVLAVDDDQGTTEYLRRLLSTAGYEVVALTDPALAEAELRRSDFHLVILDLVMPGLSGTELLQRIRAIDTDIAIIVCTGYPSVDSAVASLRAQVSDYLEKPAEPDVLLEAVRQTLAKKGLLTDAEAAVHGSIGRAIREARKVQELTLRQLARRTGLSVSLLSQIERAESSASISSLYRIAAALRVRMSELVSGA